jgi:hypothetical protein
MKIFQLIDSKTLPCSDTIYESIIGEWEHEPNRNEIYGTLCLDGFPEEEASLIADTLAEYNKYETMFLREHNYKRYV